jgi:hypothetical protein
MKEYVAHIQYEAYEVCVKAKKKIATKVAKLKPKVDRKNLYIDEVLQFN